MDDILGKTATSVRGGPKESLFFCTSLGLMFHFFPPPHLTFKTWIKENRDYCSVRKRPKTITLVCGGAVLGNYWPCTPPEF